MQTRCLDVLPANLRYQEHVRPRACNGAEVMRHSNTAPLSLIHAAVRSPELPL